jgi:predicted phosphodiesterase
MRIAVVADIHGNILALEAVLADLAAHEPDLIVNLGDCAAGPLWPRETLERLEALNLPTVRGNHDRWMATLEPAKMGPSDRFACSEISAEQCSRLGALPARLHVAPGVLAVHGTPADDNAYLLDVIEDGRLVRARAAHIAERLGPTEAPLVLCGHSHRPDIVQLPGGPIILNPGSVGNPAYRDTDHVSESGAPHARYAMVERRPDGEFLLELIAVPYDCVAAARRAETNGRPEWTHGLRTGFMSPIS